MNDDSRPPSPLLARVLQRVGHLADKDTRAGRMFARAETTLTKATETLNHSPSWLKFNGEVLRQRSGLRVRRRSLAEGALRALRLPTSSEMGELKEHIRHLEEQVGVLGSQLEVAIELLERRGPGAAAAAPAADVDASAPKPARPRA
ncbi:MAG TPA: hypothetical protein VFS43_33140 [Polyangiaceae bacterium]|nr:hypothetical protein [Polyangiaceae bacterium]